jgi:hypothetical protein
MGDNNTSLENKSSESPSISEPKSTTVVHRRSLGGVRGGLLKVGLAFLATQGTISTAATIGSLVQPHTTRPPLPAINIGETTFPQPAETQLTSVYSPESATKIKAIEAKYNINIFTVQEARAYAHQNFSPQTVKDMGIDSYKDTKVGFSDEQLSLLDEMLSYMPKHFYEPVDGQKFGIILRGDDFTFAGESNNGTRMICIGKDGVNPSDRNGTFSLLIHEGTHGLDATSNYFIWANVKDILKGSSFADLNDFDAYFASKQGLPSDYARFRDDQKAALATFSSFLLGQSLSEGIAGLSQLYVRGRVEFINAVGPLSDNGGYESADASIQIEDPNILAQKYTKATALYDLYKQMFFEGKEYDPQLVVQIDFGKDALQTEKNLISQLDSTYNIDVIDNSLVLSNPKIRATLDKILQLFPKDFYTASNGKVRIVLVENATDEGPKDPNTIYLTKDEFTVHRDPDFRISRALSDLAYSLSMRKDELNTCQARDEIVSILGGDAFLNSPESIYPRLNSYTSDPGMVSIYAMFAKGADGEVDETKLVGELSQLYAQGWGGFQEIGEILDPGVKLSSGEISDHADTKTYKLWQEMQKFFSGYSFDNFYSADDDGIPRVYPPSQ